MEVKYLSHDNIYPSIKKYTLFIYNNESEYAYSKFLQYHDFYEVQFIKSKGTSQREILGYVTLEDKTYPLFNNSLVLINLFEKHKVDIISKNCYRFCLDISPNVIHFAASQESNLLNFFSNKNKIAPVRELTEPQSDLLLGLFNQFQKAEIVNGFDIYEKGVILLMLAHLYDIYHEDLINNSSNSKHLTLIFDIIQYIDSNLGSDMSLESLSNNLHFSTYYLCHTFKRYTGFTLGKYILDRKIEIAKKTLLTDEAVEVSKALGFNNYSNFYRSFKKSTGLAPSEYKKQVMEEQEYT